MNLKDYDKFGVMQIDQADCGVACVLTIIKYFGIEAHHAVIRTAVGKTATGSTLLGLKEGLETFGITCNGYEATTDHIKDLEFPCILHTVFEEKLLHFIVLFKYDNGVFICFDPAKGRRDLSEDDLKKVWRSGRLLVVESKPTVSANVNTNASNGSEPQPKAKKNSYADLLGLFSKYQHILVVAGLLGILMSVMGLSLAVFTQFLLDKHLLDSNSDKVWSGVFLVLGILIARSLLNYARSYLLFMQSRRFNSEITESFFGKLMFVPFSFFEQKSIGDITARMRDTIRIQALITTFFGQSLIDFFVLASISIFLGLYSVTAGLLVFFAIALFIFFSIALKSKILEYQRGTMSSYGASESAFIDSFSGYETIKSYSSEKLFSRLTRGLYTNFQGKLFEFNVFRTRMSLALEVISILIIMAIVGLVVKDYLAGKASAGELAATLQLALIIQPSLLQIFASGIQVQEAFTAFERMKEYTLLEKEPDGNDQEMKVESIAAENLAFKYPGRVQLFSGLNFSALKGQIILLKGPSGKGKTTLFKLIQQFYAPTSGSIVVNGTTSLARFNAADWRRNIGFVPQDIKLFNGSLLFNICLSEEGDPSKIIEFCKSVGLDSEIMKLSDGYNTMVGETGVKLSGGQKQLVGFIRALYRRPQVLLIDEGISSMDTDLAGTIQNTLVKLLPNMITIVSSHGNEWDRLTTTKIILA